MDYSDVMRMLEKTSYSTSIISDFFQLAIAVFAIVCYWLVFAKAGEAGWKALIPFYNQYILYKISGKKKLFWWVLGLSIVTIILTIVFVVYITFALISAFGVLLDYDFSETGTVTGIVVILCLLAACGIALFVLRIFQCIGLIEKFNLSGGWAVGLILLPVVFYAILAFDKKMTYGPESDPWSGPAPSSPEKSPEDTENPYF